MRCCGYVALLSVCGSVLYPVAPLIAGCTALQTLGMDLMDLTDSYKRDGNLDEVGCNAVETMPGLRHLNACSVKSSTSSATNQKALV